MPNIKQAIKDYEQMLLNAAEYSGNKEPGKKIFSASMLGNDMLEIYLKFKHGTKDQIIFEANTLGSIYQLGVDTAADMWNKSKHANQIQYINANRLTYELSNGWIISGEMDQIDVINKVIFDNKVTTATKIQDTITNGKNSSYGLQMSVYQFLLYKQQLKDGIDTPEVYPAVLPMVDKKHSYFQTNKFNALNFIEVETHTVEDTEQLLLDKTNELQAYLDLDEEPGQCQNLFWYARKGQKRRPMKCLHYCDQNKYCKHFSEFNAAKSLLMGL